MRVYVAVQPTPKGGASSLSRYIATSKVDRDREHLNESGVRPLFSGQQDDLTFKEADLTLNPTNRQLEKEEIIHVVISPEPGSLDRAGEDEGERQKTFREAIRDMMREMQRELKVKCLSWIAGLHENTRTPHAHVAISRWALDSVTEKLRYIKHLPKSLLPHNTEDAAGVKRFLTGKIAEVFVSSLVRMLKPIRSVHLFDSLPGIDISRSIASRYAQMLRDPTPEQLTVGRWLEVALMLSTGKTGELNRGELLREYEELTIQVANIDAVARANGARPPVAYIAPERLEELINGKAANVQITVSTEPSSIRDEKYVTITTEQLPIVPSEQAAKVKSPQHENDKALLVTHHQTEDRTASKQTPGKLANVRESSQDRRETKPAERSQVQKTPETLKAQTKMKAEEPPRVGKFTLLDLRGQMQLRNDARGNPDLPLPAIAQISPDAIAKPQNADSKASADTPIQIINTISHILSADTSEHMTIAADETHDTALHESGEWEIDDDELRWRAAVAYWHFHEESNCAKERATKEGEKTLGYHESNHYFPTTQDEARLREAEMVNQICMDACLERKLTPNMEAVSGFLREQIRSGQGAIVPLMREMNMVRESIEEISSPSNQHLVDAFHRLHDLYPSLTPNVEYSRDIHEIRERSMPSKNIGANYPRLEHESSERALELDEQTHGR